MLTAQPAAMDVTAVAEELSCTTAHIANMVKQGKFPPPFRLGRANRWHSSVVQEFIAAKQQEAIEASKSPCGQGDDADAQACAAAGR